MKPRVILYGLGKEFKEDHNCLLNEYDVIGYCDQKEEKSKEYGDKWVSRGKLYSTLREDDLILITASKDRMDIMHDLILNCNVPMEKVWFFRHRGDEEVKKCSELMLRAYGQFSDDAVLWGIFQALRYEMKQIKYLEVGTNDPVLSNNTYLFYTLGARGVLVDPLPTSKMMCERMRPNDRFIGAAVSDKSGADVTLYCGVAAQGTSMYPQYAPKNHIKIKARMLGINELFEMIGYVPDLFVIDAEGEDENILRALDFEKYRPAVIELEINKADDYNTILLDYMKENGYEFIIRIGSNAIFVEKSKCDCLQFPTIKK